MKTPFKKVAWKQLRMIDVPDRGSNQHELQGVSALRSLFGDPGDRKVPIDARWLLHGTDHDEPLESRHELTWYDARASNPDRSAECRLYYPSGTGLEMAEIGDLLLVVELSDGMAPGAPRYVFHIVPFDSAFFAQVCWAFELSSTEDRFQAREASGVMDGLSNSRLDILRQLDPILDHAATWASDDEVDSATRQQFASFLRRPNPARFPSTRELAAFAQNLTPFDASDPDSSLERVLHAETAAFQVLERAVLEDRLREPFPNVDEFISFSLSVQNRRKSRRGHSLEHQLAWVFGNAGLPFKRQAVTENRSSVDFLFPSLEKYERASEPITMGICMLAAKATCKDRWRQVLAEARKLPRKHLFTLEAAISSAQTKEMGSHGLELVVPRSTVDSHENPGTAVHSLGDFMKHVESNV